MAGVYAVAGTNFRAVQIAQAFLSVAAGWLLYRLALLELGGPAAMAALALFAIDPLSIYIVGASQSEILLHAAPRGHGLHVFAVGGWRPWDTRFSSVSSPGWRR